MRRQDRAQNNSILDAIDCEGINTCVSNSHCQNNHFVPSGGYVTVFSPVATVFHTS